MRIPDEELLNQLQSCLSTEHWTLVEFLRHLMEVDRRRLYAKKGYSSLYAFLVEGLHLSESSAFRRIQVARAARTFPSILEALQRREIHLSGLSVLAPALTTDNCSDLLRRARHKSRREIDRLVSELSPQLVQVPPDRIRTLPVPATFARSVESGTSLGNHALTEAPRLGPKSTFTGEGEVDNSSLSLDNSGPSGEPRQAFEIPATDEIPRAQPVPKRVSIHFVADEEFLQCLEKARALMRHKYPEGRLEDVFREALRLYLDRKDPELRLPSRVFAEPSAGRHIPTFVKAAVWKRDEGRCSFVSAEGKRCEARAGLEFDHRIPWAEGGRSTIVNLRLLCRAHNQYAARQHFGDRFVEKKIQEARRT